MEYKAFQDLKRKICKIQYRRKNIVVCQYARFTKRPIQRITTNVST